MRQPSKISGAEAVLTAVLPLELHHLVAAVLGAVGSPGRNTGHGMTHGEFRGISQEFMVDTGRFQWISETGMVDLDLSMSLCSKEIGIWHTEPEIAKHQVASHH